MTKDGNFELIFETCNGDEVFRDESNVVVRFAQKRNGIVTSWINAGYRGIRRDKYIRLLEGPLS